MNRETTNRIRFVLEDVVPPILRDSKLFKGLASLVWGKHIGDLATFRARAPFLTDQEYEDLYKTHPRVHEGTDNSKGCIAEIVKDIVGGSVCDVGCGTGILLKHIQNVRPDVTRLMGVDFAIDDADALPLNTYWTTARPLPNFAELPRNALSSSFLANENIATRLIRISISFLIHIPSCERCSLFRPLIYAKISAATYIIVKILPPSPPTPCLKPQNENYCATRLRPAPRNADYDCCRASTVQADK